MLDYSELSAHLYNVEAETCAAECHGFLCGQVCVTGFPAEELWQEFIDARSADEQRVVDCYRYIRILVAEIMDNIQSPELNFQLMLPDSECPIEDRINALAEWCHGFLNGYGSEAQNLEKALTEESRDVLEDFTRICRVEVNDNTDEEDEKALMELIEYVRIGTVMIYDELASDDRLDGNPGVLH